MITGLAWIPVAAMVSLGVTALVLMRRHERRWRRREKADPRVIEAWKGIVK